MKQEVQTKSTKSYHIDQDMKKLSTLLLLPLKKYFFEVSS